MKILHTVEFYEPAKGGSEEVVRQISERLVQRGHEVTVATSYHPQRQFDTLNGVKIKQFKIQGNLVKGLKGDIGSFENFLRMYEYDIIMNYAAQSWPTDISMKILTDIKAKKILMPVGYSKINNSAYSKYYLQLPGYLNKYDMLIYTSPNYHDKKFGDEHGFTERSAVIRNGASLEEFSTAPLGFRKKYRIDTKFMFLTVANHYFSKGHTFVIKSVNMLKRKDFSLVIIGEPPNAHSWYSCYPYCLLHSKINRRIFVLRNVPREFVVSAYLEADAFLFGSKIECAPLVMYESFASHTPFITRNVGNVSDHLNIIHLVNTPEEMAGVLVNLMENPKFYKEIADCAYNEFLQSYNWEKITNQIEEIYKSVLLR